MDEATCWVTIDSMTFARRLREARQAAGLTQQQVADACGLTDGAVSAWERGGAENIGAHALFAVADALGVDPRWLATGDESRPALLEVTHELAKLPPEQQAAVRALIHSLKR